MLVHSPIGVCSNADRQDSWKDGFWLPVFIKRDIAKITVSSAIGHADKRAVQEMIGRAGWPATSRRQCGPVSNGTFSRDCSNCSMARSLYLHGHVRSTMLFLAEFCFLGHGGSNPVGFAAENLCSTCDASRPGVR